MLGPHVGVEPRKRPERTKRSLVISPCVVSTVGGPRGLRNLARVCGPHGWKSRALCLPCCGCDKLPFPYAPLARIHNKVPYVSATVKSKASRDISGMERDSFQYSGRYYSASLRRMAASTHIQISDGPQSSCQPALLQEGEKTEKPLMVLAKRTQAPRLRL